MRHAEVDEDLRSDAVLALVRCETELEVRLDRVAALVLQLVRPQLVGEADRSTLVPAHVQHDPPPFLADQLHRPGELRPAVASQGSEDVARQALGVHAGQHAAPLADLSHHESDVRAPVDDALVRVRTELTVRRRDGGLGHPLHEDLAATAMLDQVRDRDDLQIVFAREPHQIGKPRHRAVVVHGLAEHARRIQARQPSEIDGGLGVSCPHEHAALPIAQREDVARP